AERDPVQSRVLQRSFQDVSIFSVPAKPVHPLIPKYHSYRRAGFTVGLTVRKMIRKPESFVAFFGADPSCYIEVPAHHVLPNGFQRLPIRTVAGSGFHIRCPRIQIHGPHRMPLDPALGLNRHIVLTITRFFPFVPDRPFTISMPSLVQEPFA